VGAQQQFDLVGAHVATQGQHQRVVEQRPARVDQRGVVAIGDQELVGLYPIVATDEVVVGDAAMPVRLEQHETHRLSPPS
jgi:hypothetical protein